MFSGNPEVRMSSIVYALTEDPRTLSDPLVAERAQKDALAFCSSLTMYQLEQFDPRAVAANPVQAQQDLINSLF